MQNYGRDELAARLKAIRKRKKKTLTQIEQACGVSASTISKIENGSLSPTYANLLRLAKGLEVDIVDIVSEGVQTTAKTRRSVTPFGEGVQYSIGTHDYRVLCSDLANKKMLPMLATIKAKSLHELETGRQNGSGGLASHQGEEVLFVVSGEVVLHTEHYTPITMHPGDCAYIDSSMGHACLKGSDEDAVVFWVCSDAAGSLEALSGTKTTNS